MLRNEEFHTEGGVIMTRTTTRMMTEVVMDRSVENNPGQIVEMGGEVRKWIVSPDLVLLVSNFSR